MGIFRSSQTAAENRSAFLDGGISPGGPFGLLTLETVVLAGHGAPPEYAGQSADAIASAAACFHPSLVVVDTCFGAAAPLLSSLAARLNAWVVAAPLFVPGRGFRYEAAFFSTGKAKVRADAVHTILPRPLLRLHLDAALTSAAEARVAAKPEDAQRARLWSWIPTLVTEELAPGQQLFVPVDWRRIRPQPKMLGSVHQPKELAPQRGARPRQKPRSPG